jgi:signal transduction histidine kinase/ligand-binding sensor domain-containing protein
MARRVLLPVLLVLYAGSGWALDSNRRLTQYVHRIWTTQQGLPPGTINDIWQTRYGYLWLGTQTGLVRFDGVRFTDAETLYPKLPENLWIRSGFEDPSGALWVGTNDTGIFRLQDREAEHFSTKEGLPSDQVYCVLPGAGGAVWACTANGLARLADDKIEVLHLSSAPTGDKVVRAACVASNGRLWAGGDAPVLYAEKGDSFQSTPLQSIPPDASIRAIVCGRSSIWVGTTAGLVEVNGTTQHLYTSKDGLAEDGVLSLNEGVDGSLWVGTRGGFSRLRNGEFESFLPQDGLSQSSVSSLYEDHEGSLWAGTKHGLNQFVDGRAVPYTVSEGLPSNNTGPLMEDRSGTVWIGTLDRGLARFDGRRFPALSVPQGLASPTVLSLSSFEGAIWAGTNHGLNVLENGRVVRRFTAREGLPSDEIRTVYADPRGILWAGTAAGPAILSGGGFSALPGAPPDPVVAMGSDQHERLLFSTEHGLFRMDGESVKEISPGGAPLRNIDAMYRDSEGLVWLAANGNGGGLRVLDERGAQPKMSTFLVRDGLFDGEIYGIVPDDQGRLWMACSKGIFSVERAEMLRFMAGEIKKISSTPYSPTDASRVIECKPGVQPAAWRMRDGQIWFSTIRGLIVIDPEHLKRNVLPPPIVIEDPIVNGEPENAARIGDLAPGQKNLTFNYTGLSFVAPTRLTFRYRLEGYDKDWIDAGARREAFYTNLPPGTFTFHVAACNLADDLCNEAGAAVQFTLAPAYYQRVWFGPLLALLAGLAGWLAYQSRIRRLRERYDLIVAERSRIARELHDTLIQGFSGITMGMQALAARLRPSEERNKLQDIIADAATCLRETRRSVAGLRGAKAPSASGLASSIAQAARQITETKSVRLKLRLEAEPPNLAPELEYNLLRIATEAVSNAVKHSGARTIEVTLRPAAHPAQGVIFLSVADDGNGCEPSENGHLKPGHYGLIGMKERAAQIGAQFAFDSAPGRGTIVSVMAPVERSTAMEVEK